MNMSRALVGRFAVRRCRILLLFRAVHFIRNQSPYAVRCFRLRYTGVASLMYSYRGCCGSAIGVAWMARGRRLHRNRQRRRLTRSRWFYSSHPRRSFRARRHRIVGGCSLMCHRTPFIAIVVNKLTIIRTGVHHSAGIRRNPPLNKISSAVPRCAISLSTIAAIHRSHHQLCATSGACFAARFGSPFGFGAAYNLTWLRSTQRHQSESTPVFVLTAVPHTISFHGEFPPWTCSLDEGRPAGFHVHNRNIVRVRSPADSSRCPRHACSLAAIGISFDGAAKPTQRAVR